MDDTGFYYTRLEVGVKYKVNDPPRLFKTGRGEIVTIKDCAHIELEPDEQVTFKTESGAEYDVARKSWGFYATPSLNGRLTQFGLRGVIVKNPSARFFIFLVENGKEDDFRKYVDIESLTIVCWIDNDHHLKSLDEGVGDTYDTD